MTQIRQVNWNGRTFTVTISDETSALLAAYQAGGAVLGVWKPGCTKQCLEPADFVVENPTDIDDKMLLLVAQRRYGIPWQIAFTDRLLIREFAKDDPLETEQAEGVMNQVFTDHAKRDSYIRHHYGFYGYGIWALVEKQSGTIIGKAGLAEGRLGYHIHQPYRRQGYGWEACMAIIRYAGEQLYMDRLKLWVDPENTASLALARKLGFIQAGWAETEDKRQVICMERDTKL